MTAEVDEPRAVPGCGLYVSEAQGRYGFPDHPFGTDRQQAFYDEALARGLHQRASLLEPSAVERELLERFHAPGYVDRLRELSERGSGLLDMGDTPAFAGCYEAAGAVAAAAVDAVERIMAGELRAAMVPIAGLHHARRGRAGGFCIVNDCGVAIETLLAPPHSLERVAYVDIDAHHGDGVYYGFEDEPRVIVADLHEDGRFLYPGTGSADERGTGQAEGTKLNLPQLPGATDDAFEASWAEAEAFVEAAQPQFIVLHCGADSVAGDPLTHMAWSVEAHRAAARSLRRIADAHAGGRLLALGGGGYNRNNLAAAWCNVLEELL
jgi:acetoin utilization protein AcuC